MLKDKWEHNHINANDIQYGLFLNDELMYVSTSKPEIMIFANSHGWTKDSYKNPNDFITAPHLKEGVVIKMRPLTRVWR